MEKLLEYSANYGFPMVVAGYLLVRIESKLDKLAASIHDLANVIASKF
jgi:hypothetical protein